MTTSDDPRSGPATEDPDGAPTNTVLGPDAIRILAHPLRSRLLTELRLEGPATATTLAARLATNTGATSYHLRRLASVGLVVEARGGGARERRWKAAQDMHTWFSSRTDTDPDTQAAAEWLAGASMRRFQELADAWRQTERDWPAGWRDASGTSDYVVDLSAEQLDRLMTDIGALVTRAMRMDPGDGHRRVFLYVHAFPQASE